MKNGRGLVALTMASALVAGSLLLAINYEKIKEKIVNSSFSAPYSSPKKDERGINISETWKNVRVLSGNELRQSRFGDETDKLEKVVLGTYTLPNGTEISLSAKEYKTEVLASQAEVGKNYGQVTSSPFMLQKGKVLIATENLDEVFYGAEGVGAINPQDKSEFAKVWESYIKRTGGESNLIIDENGKVIHTGLNKDLSSKVEDAAFAQVVREQESGKAPSVEDIIKAVGKDGQEDFFTYESALTREEREDSSSQKSEERNYPVTELTDRAYINIDGDLMYKNKNNLDKYFINEEKNPDLTLTGDYPGLQEWMEKEGMQGYELRKYRFENSTWESIGLAIFDYGKDNKKKVFDYQFSPLNDYGFILEDGKFAYFNFSSFGNNPEINKEYLTAIVNYQKENKAKLYFSYEGKNIKISPEEYMKRLSALVKEYSKNDYWKERGKSEITEQLLK